jgi:hypothetical protein
MFDSVARRFVRSGSFWFALGFLEDLECGKMRVMTKETPPGNSTTRRYTKQEKDQAVCLMFEICKALGTSQGTVIRITDQLRYGTESLRRSVAQAEVDAGDVSDWECQLALQDALRTRFIENWCKVVQTVEYSKPLLRRGSRVYPLVRGLWRDGLLIRRLEVRVLPGVPR